MFQSTPVIANGRIVGTTDIIFPLGMFQSTPVIANGRIHRVGEVSAEGRVVSIHARYC